MELQINKVYNGKLIKLIVKLNQKKTTTKIRVSSINDNKKNNNKNTNQYKKKSATLIITWMTITVYGWIKNHINVPTKKKIFDMFVDNREGEKNNKGK